MDRIPDINEMAMGLLWYEPAAGVPLQDRIDAACDRYLDKFEEPPNLVLINATEEVPIKRITIRVDSRVGKGYVLVGRTSNPALPRWKPPPGGVTVTYYVIGQDGKRVRITRNVPQPKGRHK